MVGRGGRDRCAVLGGVQPGPYISEPNEMTLAAE